MTGKNADETTFFIDPSNYYIIKQINKETANGQEQENTSFFGNYKKLDEGIVYAMSVNSGWGETEVTKLEINPVIDPNLFKPAQ